MIFRAEAADIGVAQVITKDNDKIGFALALGSICHERGPERQGGDDQNRFAVDETLHGCLKTELEWNSCQVSAGQQESPWFPMLVILI